MHLTTPIGEIAATEEDISLLLARNPLAQEQLKNIILERALVETHKQLQVLTKKEAQEEEAPK